MLARLDRLTYNEDLDAAQPAHGHGHGEVAVHAADVGSQHPLSISQGDTGQGHRADLGQEDAPVAVDHKVVGDLDQAVDLHRQLVAGAEHVAGRDRRCLGRVEAPGVGEQLVSEQAQVLASCPEHETLELRLLQLLSLRRFGLDLLGDGVGCGRAQLGGHRLAPQAGEGGGAFGKRIQGIVQPGLQYRLWLEGHAALEPSPLLGAHVLKLRLLCGAKVLELGLLRRGQCLG